MGRTLLAERPSKPKEKEGRVFRGQESPVTFVFTGEIVPLARHPDQASTPDLEGVRTQYEAYVAWLESGEAPEALTCGHTEVPWSAMVDLAPGIEGTSAGSFRVFDRPIGVMPLADQLEFLGVNRPADQEADQGVNQTADQEKVRDSGSIQDAQIRNSLNTLLRRGTNYLESSARFLETNAQGVRSNRFTREDVEQNLEEVDRQIESLDRLDAECEPILSEGSQVSALTRLALMVNTGEDLDFKNYQFEGLNFDPQQIRTRLVQRFLDGDFGRDLDKVLDFIDAATKKARETDVAQKIKAQRIKQGHQDITADDLSERVKDELFVARFGHNVLATDCMLISNAGIDYSSSEEMVHLLVQAVETYHNYLAYRKLIQLVRHRLVQEKKLWEARERVFDSDKKVADVIKRFSSEVTGDAGLLPTREQFRTAVRDRIFSHFKNDTKAKTNWGEIDLFGPDEGWNFIQLYEYLNYEAVEGTELSGKVADYLAVFGETIFPLGKIFIGGRIYNEIYYTAYQSIKDLGKGLDAAVWQSDYTAADFLGANMKLKDGDILPYVEKWRGVDTVMLMLHQIRLIQKREAETFYIPGASLDSQSQTSDYYSKTIKKLGKYHRQPDGSPYHDEQAAINAFDQVFRKRVADFYGVSIANDQQMVEYMKAYTIMKQPRFASFMNMDQAMFLLRNIDKISPLQLTKGSQREQTYKTLQLAASSGMVTLEERKKTTRVTKRGLLKGENLILEAREEGSRLMLRTDAGDEFVVKVFEEAEDPASIEKNYVCFRTENGSWDVRKKTKGDESDSGTILLTDLCREDYVSGYELHKRVKLRKKVVGRNLVLKTSGGETNYYWKTDEGLFLIEDLETYPDESGATPASFKCIYDEKTGEWSVKKGIADLNNDNEIPLSTAVKECLAEGDLPTLAAFSIAGVSGKESLADEDVKGFDAVTKKLVQRLQHTVRYLHSNYAQLKRYHWDVIFQQLILPWEQMIRFEKQNGQQVSLADVHQDPEIDLSDERTYKILWNDETQLGSVSHSAGDWINRANTLIGIMEDYKEAMGMSMEVFSNTLIGEMIDPQLLVDWYQIMRKCNHYLVDMFPKSEVLKAFEAAQGKPNSTLMGIRKTLEEAEQAALEGEKKEAKQKYDSVHARLVMYANANCFKGFVTDHTIRKINQGRGQDKSQEATTESLKRLIIGYFQDLASRKQVTIQQVYTFAKKYEREIIQNPDFINLLGDIFGMERALLTERYQSDPDTNKFNVLYDEQKLATVRLLYKGKRGSLSDLRNRLKRRGFVAPEGEDKKNIINGLTITSDKDQRLTPKQKLQLETVYVALGFSDLVSEDQLNALPILRKSDPEDPDMRRLPSPEQMLDYFTKAFSIQQLQTTFDQKKDSMKDNLKEEVRSFLENPDNTLSENQIILILEGFRQIGVALGITNQRLLGTDVIYYPENTTVTVQNYGEIMTVMFNPRCKLGKILGDGFINGLTGSVQQAPQRYDVNGVAMESQRATDPYMQYVFSPV